MALMRGFRKRAFGNLFWCNPKFHSRKHSSFRYTLCLCTSLHNKASSTTSSSTCTSHKHTVMSCMQFSFTNVTTCSKNSQQHNVIEAWFYEVKTFGKIDIQVPFNLEVKPLDPLEYPDMNKFILEISTGSGLDNKISRSVFGNLYDLDIDVEDDKETIKVRARTMDDGLMEQLPVTCSIQIPIKFDVHIQSHNEDVSVKNFETEKISIASNEGNCYLHKLKCGKIDVKSYGGNIISTGLLQGNITLSTITEGVIQGDKLQGQGISCSSKNGKIDIKTLYANNTDITTDSGNVNLRNCHGSTKINVKNGNLTIGSLDGNLQYKSQESNIDVCVARSENVDIETDEGDISLKVSGSLATDIMLTAEFVTVGDDVNFTREVTNNQNLVQYTGNMNGKENESKLSVITRQGKITLNNQDWFSSLKLSYPRK